MRSFDPAMAGIVERASTLAERCGNSFVPAPGDGARAEAWAGEWRQVAGKGCPDRFARRLARDGLTPEAVRQAVAPVRLADGEQLPPWAELLGRMLDALSAARERWDGGSPGGDARVRPFEDLLGPLAEPARADLAARAGGALALLGPGALRDLEDQLLGRFSRLAAPVLHRRFTEFRAEHDPRYTGLAGAVPEGAAGSAELYGRFVGELLGGGMRSLLAEYSVLGRLLATAASFWTDAAAELLLRLAEDRNAIRDELAGGEDPGDVAALHLSLGDPHRQGRSVVGVEFSRGLRVMYKPRDLRLERRYSDLLGWLNERGALPLRRLREVYRPSHGWVEFAEHAPCADEGEVRDFYRRAGMLLAVVHALGGVDCHCENLLACGPHPVLVDMEMLLQPRVRPAEPPADRIRSLASRRLYDDSVLCTGLLPFWQTGPGAARSYDISGLSNSGGDETPFRSPRWKDVNTDGMTLVEEAVRTAVRSNLPVLDGHARDAAPYVDEIVRGFRETYVLLMAEREALTAPGGPLEGLGDEPVRFLLRPSNVYGSVLKTSLREEFLRDGARRSIQIDVLSRGLMQGDPALWPLLKVEAAALERMDIPHFTTAAGSWGLDVEGARVEGCFPQSCRDVLASRLASFSPADLEWQTGLVRNAFGLRFPTGRGVDAGAPDDPGIVEPLDARALVAHAIAIAERIRDSANRDRDGAPTWATLEPVSADGRFRLNATGAGMYAGLGGIALFLAAAARVTGRGDFRRLALEALAPLRRALRQDSPGMPVAREFGLGGAEGIGSALYVLVGTGRFLRDETLLRDARAAAAQVTPEAIAADRSFDLMYGSAGAILGLLALHEALPEAELLERAAECGFHLLHSRSPTDAGLRAWRTTGGASPLTGLSHGAAGIAYALLRLHAATGEAAFRAAAAEAVEFERSVFCTDAGNWPDLRVPPRPGEGRACMTTWCHGAPGIGMARAAALRLGDDDVVAREEVAPAAGVTLRVSPQRADSPCCGNFGLVEALLTMGLHLDNRSWVEAAHERAARVVRRAEATGGFRLVSRHADGVYNPGFHQGTAGIGYQLLRLAHPDEVPSALLWE